MQCPKCGNQNPDDARICQSCSLELPKISSTAQRQNPMTSALAILSFGLSIMSIVFFPFILIAVIFGIVSIIKITKSKGMLRGKGFATLGIIISIIVFFMWLPVINKIRQNAYRIVCGENLSELRKAILLYTEEHDGALPTSSKWCDLLTKHTKVNSSMFHCKGTKKGPCNYAINKKIVQLNRNTPHFTVLLYETRPGWNQYGGPEILTTDNHYGKGCNILFVDMHIQFIETEYLKNLKWEPD